MLTQTIATAGLLLLTTTSASITAPEKLAMHSNDSKRAPCLDVVFPTYRCDLSKLRELMSRNCEAAVSLNTIVVLGQPDAPNLEEIKALQSYKVDQVVRCCVHAVRSNHWHS